MGLNRVYNKKLNDEFEVDGLWWLPNLTENKVPGTLFFNNNKIRLEIMGSLRNNQGFQAIFNVSNEPIEIIYGQSGYGEKFTLMEADASFGESVNSHTGFKSEEYRISSFLVGDKFIETEKMYFHSCRFFPTHLTAWLNKSPIKMDIEQNKIDFNIESANASYEKIDTFSHEVHVLNAKIEERFNSKFNIDTFRESLHWEFSSGISITTNKEAMNMQWFNLRRTELRNLLSVLIGESIHYNSIYFIGEFKDRDTSYEHTPPIRNSYAYFITQRNYKFKEKLNPMDMLISFEDIEERLGYLFNNWFEKNEELKEIYRLFFGLFYSDVVYLDTSLLNTIQILEIYHRNKQNKSKGFSNKDWDKSESREKKRSKVHSKRYTLRERLTELINNFSYEARQVLIGKEKDEKKFIKQLVETRNYLAHYDLKGKPNLLTSIDEKFYGIQRLKAIVTLIIFIELGLDEKMVLEKIKNSKQFSFSLVKAKKYLND